MNVFDADTDALAPVCGQDPNTALAGLPGGMDPSDQTLAALDATALRARCQGLQAAYGALQRDCAGKSEALTQLRTISARGRRVAELARQLKVNDLDTVAAIATAQIAEFLGAASAALWLVDEEGEHLQLYRTHPEAEKRPHYHLRRDAETLLVRVLLEQRTPVAPGSPKAHGARAFLRECARDPLAAELGVEALLCPLVVESDGETPGRIGVLALRRREAPSDGDLELAELLAEIVASAVQTCRLVTRLSQLAETDGLTGLANHRHFMLELERSMAVAHRYGEHLSLIMCDLDRFKLVNDTWGHTAGDRVLQEVARLIRHSIREQVDLVARYGGEEFAIILPHTNMAGALVAAERLRGAIVGAVFEFAETTTRMTISAGVAEYVDGWKKTDFVEAADAALYQAKRNGRNRVEYARVRPSMP